MERDLKDLAGAFARAGGHVFRDPRLLEQALTHSGAADAGGDYQRLEFLGDRVLGLIVAEALFRRYPDSGEGALARRLNCLVRGETCAEVARALGLDALMRTGENTPRGQAQASQNVLADLCEAVIAAVYLDGGLQAARRFVLPLWEPFFARCGDAPRDPKSALQEWAAARGLPAPRYAEVSRSGPDHAPHFVMEARIEGLGAARGEGGAKRRAEQAAAAALLSEVGGREET